MGRSPKPFFDLPMNTGARPPARPPVSIRPVGIVEPKGTGRSYLPPTEATDSPETASKPIEFSISTLYWAAAGIMVILLAVWILGVKAGKSDAERRLGSQLAQQQAEPPNRPSTPSNIEPPPPAVNPEPPPAPKEPAKGSSAPSGPGDTYTGSGWVTIDPRQDGLNYLHLATLRRADAVRAVDYLASKGKTAIAVPSKTVDRSPEAAKNPLLFVYLATPLSRDQYRDAAQRTRIETEVRQIGQQWVKSKDKGGVPSDFSKPQWVKYEKN